MWQLKQRSKVCLIGALMTLSAAAPAPAGERLSLAGEWKLRMDPNNQGVNQRWFEQALSEPVRIPGSLADSGYGTPPDPSARSGYSWAPALGFSFTDAAWFQKEVEIPETWQGKRIELFLERVHWWTELWVEGQPVRVTHQPVSVPQGVDLTTQLTPGRHKITVRMTLGPAGHVYHTSHHFRMQAGWCGMIGDCSLRATDPVWIESLQVYPEVAKGTAKVRITLGNITGKPAQGTVVLKASPKNSKQKVAETKVSFTAAEKNSAVEAVVPMGADVQLWDEFNPNLYRMKAELAAGANRDTAEATFGMREFKAKGTQFTINGRPVLMRGRTDDAIFPKTLYPPMDVAEWKRLLGICKEWGLNHVRFHSWCPPEAAFVAADELGVYLQPEGPAFGKPTTPEQKEMLAEECRRILDAYGNHPSFVLFTGGNEWDGFDEWVEEWRKRDDRRLYSHATNRGFRPVSDYWVAMLMPNGQPLRGAYHNPGMGNINNRPPSTLVDYSGALKSTSMLKVDRPLIAHEVGQFNAFPNYREIEKARTSAVRLPNYELYREGLVKNHMLDQADDFVRASGELQVILYREEVEAALRTPGFGGFQLLDLQDYPSQGTAICGILDIFMESKGYGNPAEFRQWCASITPLLRIKQYTWSTDETFSAEAQLAHYGPKDLDPARMSWSVRDASGREVASGTLPGKKVAPGKVASFGTIEFPLASVPAPAVYTVGLELKDQGIKNQWNIWVYPERLPEAGKDVLIVDKWDAAAREKLAAGGSVLYLPKASAWPRSIQGSFAIDFWSYPMFRTMNPPGTDGLLCDPKHPVFAAFPTEFHSNWQWWDLLKKSRSMVLDDFPRDFRPLVQIIDNLQRNHRLAALFEARVSGGRLMVCSMDLTSDLEKRPAARQFRYSVLRYMESKDFKPAKELSSDVIANLGRAPNNSEGLTISEPTGTHRASLIVAAGANVRRGKPWSKEDDRVDKVIPEFGYGLIGGANSAAGSGTTYWQGKELALTVSCPKGYTGHVHVHFKDLDLRNRTGEIFLDGRRIGTLKNHEYGAWVTVPLTAVDTADGQFVFKATAGRGDLIVTDLVVMPSGQFDPG